MKKNLLMLVCAVVATTASAQYYQDAVNKDMLHITTPRTTQRVEFSVPSVDGYTAYKADLHTHTIYSDGAVTMAERVREAWYDGVDVMAVTEHLEYRPRETMMVEYLAKYMPANTKAKDNSFVSKNRPESGDAIMVDLNYPVKDALKCAKAFPITIIPGIEITRKEEGWYSHFNALFTTDNNAIYDPDALQSLRNAKAQNALILHNHPGWRHLDLELTSFEKKAYKAGVIDGIEIMNGVEFYPRAIDRAFKYNLFVSSNTDVHAGTERYSKTGAFRNLTIIFAKDRSLASIREALEAHRTLAYSFGTLAGSEELLRKVFEGAVKIADAGEDSKGEKQIILTNNSSLEWLIAREGKRMDILKPHSSILITLSSSQSNDLIIKNAWYGEGKNLVYNLNL